MKILVFSVVYQVDSYCVFAYTYIHNSQLAATDCMLYGYIQFPDNCIDGSVRLLGGHNESEGAVQICIDESWGSVCGTSWGTKDASVVCRQLGLPTTGLLFNHEIIIILL